MKKKCWTGLLREPVREADCGTPGEGQYWWRLSEPEKYGTRLRPRLQVDWSGGDLLRPFAPLVVIGTDDEHTHKAKMVVLIIMLMMAIIIIYSNISLIIYVCNELKLLRS